MAKAHCLWVWTAGPRACRVPSFALGVAPGTLSVRMLMSELASSVRVGDERPPDVVPRRPQRVFLSHSSHDASIAHELARALADAGIQATVQVEVPSEVRDYLRSATRRISETDALVVILTGADVPYITAEVAHALSLRKPVLPLVLSSNAELPALLRNWFYLDGSRSTIAELTPRIVAALSLHPSVREDASQRLLVNTAGAILKDELAGLQLELRGRQIRLWRELISIVPAVLSAVVASSIGLWDSSWPLSRTLVVAVAAGLVVSRGLEVLLVKASLSLTPGDDPAQSERGHG